METTTRYGGAVSATLAGIRDRLLRAPPPVDPALRLDGRSVLVTGAGRGLGLAITQGLAALGADVHVAVRSRAEETVAAALAAGAPAARAWPLDLERLSSVDALARSLAGARLDRVVLNAGMVANGARVTPHGLDVMLQVNALANVRLVDRLVAEGAIGPGSRVVIVGSEAHRSAQPIDWSRLDEPRSYTMSGAVAEYGRTKLVLHTWAAELARRLAPEICVAHLCPGAVASEIAREAPGWANLLLGPVMRLMFQPPEVAARPAISLCATAEVEPGTYLHLGRRVEPSAEALAGGAACWEAAHAVLARVHGEA